MTTLKQGDLIKDSEGNTLKVMETCGTILHISYKSNHAKYNFTSDEAGLKDFGYTWDTPAWEPEVFENYWFIDLSGGIFNDVWEDDTDDHNRRDFLGIYQTEELAKAALLEIRRKLGK